MKNLLFIAIAIFGFSAVSFAQPSVGVTASATATGTIVSPITITNAGNLNFGNVAVSAAGGTVILAPAGTRSLTGGVTLPVVPGTVAAAHFAITGAPSYTYAITLPSTATTVTSSGNTMSVDVFTSFPASTGVLDGTGKQTINVGATLNVTASQAAGTYVSGTPFDVTVNYN